jgi:hypothetical protein
LWLLPETFPDDSSWGENNETNERLARERAISGGSSPPPKLAENNLYAVTNNSRHPTHLHVDETTLMFSSNAVFAYPYDDENGKDTQQHEWQDNTTHDDKNQQENVDTR